LRPSRDADGEARIAEETAQACGGVGPVQEAAEQAALGREDLEDRDVLVDVAPAAGGGGRVPRAETDDGDRARSRMHHRRGGAQRAVDPSEGQGAVSPAPRPDLPQTLVAGDERGHAGGVFVEQGRPLAVPWNRIQNS
jgi:hypothetical protein